MEQTVNADSLNIILSSQEAGDLDLFSTATVLSDSSSRTAQETSNATDQGETGLETNQQHEQLLCLQSVSGEGTLVFTPSEEEAPVHHSLNSASKVDDSQPSSMELEEVQHVKYHLVYNPQTKTICLASSPVLTTSATKSQVKTGVNQPEVIKIINGNATELTLEEPLCKLDQNPAIGVGHSDDETAMQVANNMGPQTGYLYKYVCNEKFLPSVHRASRQAYQRSLMCNFEGCNRKFTWPAHLKYHQLTHTGERMYQCQLEGCGRRFYTAQRLMVHLRTHTGEKPFICDVEDCGKSFTTAGNLKNHRRVHTGERPFQCAHEGCSRAFAEQSSLRKHELTHSRLKPFPCEYCDRTFSQSGSRNVHMKRHKRAGKNPGQFTQANMTSQSTDMVVDMETHNVLVLGQQQDAGDTSEANDLSGFADNVVFSNGVSDHVVTVTTQPAELERPPSQTTQSGEVNAAECEMESISVLTVDPSSNVVVLSQPDDIDSMAAGYDIGSTTSEELIYNGILPHSSLDQEEITDTMTSHGLNIEQDLERPCPEDEGGIVGILRIQDS